MISTFCNYSNFSEADFTEAKASYAGFIDCNFTETICHDMIAIDANFDRANFTLADLQDAKFIEASFCGANFDQANILNINWGHTDLRGATGYVEIDRHAIDLLIKLAHKLTDNPELLLPPEESLHLEPDKWQLDEWICQLDATAQKLATIWGVGTAACIACPISSFTSILYSSKAEILIYLSEIAMDNGNKLKSQYINKE